MKWILYSALLVGFLGWVGCDTKECEGGATPDPAGNCPITEDDDDTQ